MARIEQQLVSLLAPAVEALGFTLWGVEFVRAGKHSTLRVYIDHEDGISVDDCADVSYQASALLDVEDPIKSEYFLEVSSPGMERPFFSAAQMQQYLGEIAAVELNVAQQNKRKFKGVISKVEGDTVEFNVDGEPLLVNYSSVKKAHLVPQFN
ncbi:ribosome maturation factor RimP [Pseudidiomarina salilacus]|uniref:ribosome maturation factor RimP n=1 Tax=Pseudidiomarina salilacus TaxID=3384452 RepID=UPI003984FB3D